MGETTEEPETPSCSTCCAEPCGEDFLTEGWSESEYGLVCPECAGLIVPVGESVGIGGIAQLMDIDKIQEKVQ